MVASAHVRQVSLALHSHAVHVFFIVLSVSIKGSHHLPFAKGLQLSTFSQLDVFTNRALMADGDAETGIKIRAAHVIPTTWSKV